ncbi:MAG: BsuBI/PstI family type II restriction endonuclease [Verrucomicrobiales bacterium]
MPPRKTSSAKKKKLYEAIEALTFLQFGPRQRNETAGYTLLALLNLEPCQGWNEAEAPLRGITPIIEFIAKVYRVHYAPNTRETIRDEAIKFFVEEALVLRNPDDSNRPTNSGKTAYQVEPAALALLRKFGTATWDVTLAEYLTTRLKIKNEITRSRTLTRVPVTLPNGHKVALSPGGQNTLIKDIIEKFCPRFAPGGFILYIGDTETKFAHMERESLKDLGVTLSSSAKTPDVIVYYPSKNWLLLIEAVATAGAIDGKRRKELKDLFSGSKAGLVFVTTFKTRRAMQSFVSQISWESEVWIAEDPDHLIHFNGERFLGPYPDVSRQSTKDI